MPRKLGDGTYLIPRQGAFERAEKAEQADRVIANVRAVARTIRQFRFGGQGKDDRVFTLLQIAHEPTDFSDAEFERIAALPVGGRLVCNEETSRQFYVERVA